MLRRLAPRSSKIEIGALPPDANPLLLLSRMGMETANVHLATADAEDIRRDLARRRRAWLEAAARRMVKQVLADWMAWRAKHG